MSFASGARQVRDPALPLWRRYSALRGCVASFSSLTQRSYNATLERLGLTWSIVRPADPPTDEFLRRTLDLLERERNRYLAGLRAFELRRVRAKMRGGRQPSRAERDGLAALRERVDAALVPVPKI
ncbi:MAG TPA: hypothetical protein VK358_12090 [Longimicrobium sp.]|nr:hypothetical protein [Longimicrobium sp.]